MRTLTTALALLCTTALCGSAFAADPGVTPDGLQKIEGSRVMLAYARPDTHWGKYKTVQVLPLVIPPGIRGRAPSEAWYEAWYEEPTGLSDEDAAGLQQFYADTFRAELQKEGFAVVEAPRADTLVIASELTDIISNPPGPAGLEPSGSVAVKVTMADGSTHQVVSTAADRKFAHYLYPENTHDTDLEQVRDAFENWTHVLAQDLRARVDKPEVDLWSCLNERKGCPPNIGSPR